MSEILYVSGAEFIRKVKKLGRRRGVPVDFVEERGKGSHGTLYFRNRLTVGKHRAAELKPGLLHGMLRQLGLTLDDLRGE